MRRVKTNRCAVQCAVGASRLGDDEFGSRGWCSVNAATEKLSRRRVGRRYVAADH